MSDLLHGWTIYRRPHDHARRKFIARRWTARDGQLIMAMNLLSGETLDEVRSKLPRGLVRFDRNEPDDANVVETWL